MAIDFAKAKSVSSSGKVNSKGNPLLFTDAVKKRVIAWLVVNPKRLKILSAFSFMSLVTLV